ncbi:hypothetical protein LSTR_LSTR000958 [Laodelphax striatellus]|uniref:Uncharacterized protein n=1 Tax=Laodelphax striatellus TaxID=195883 RepID=A0A482X0Q1_LAOST|nr:hypothetical protein LSTR_LSTR000958 [Laodelphax striatellus]
MDISSFSHDFLIEISGNNQEVHDDVIQDIPSVDPALTKQSANIQLDYPLQTSPQEYSNKTDQKGRKSSEKLNISENNSLKKIINLDPSVSIVRLDCPLDNSSRGINKCKKVESRSIPKSDVCKNTSLEASVVENTVQDPPYSRICNLKPCVSVIRLDSPSKEYNNNSPNHVKRGKAGNALEVSENNSLMQEVSGDDIRKKKSPDNIHPGQSKGMELQTNPMLDPPPQEHGNSESKEVESRSHKKSNICISTTSREKLDGNAVQKSLSSILGHLKPCVSIIRLACPLKNPSKENNNACSTQVKTRSSDNSNLKKDKSENALKNQSSPVLSHPEVSSVSVGPSLHSLQSSSRESNNTSFNQVRRKSLETSDISKNMNLRSMRKELSEFTVRIPPSSGHIQPQASCSRSIAYPTQRSSVKQKNIRANQITNKPVEKSIRKQYHCPYCRSLNMNLCRHLITMHSAEKEVKEYLKYDKHSYERVQLLRILKSRGDNLFYLEALKNKQHELAHRKHEVGHSSSAKNVNETAIKSLKKKYLYYCPFCRKPNRELPPHLEKIHPEEKEVKELMKHDKKSLERFELLKLLRDRGNKLHNLEVLKKKHSVIAVKRSAGIKSGASTQVGKNIIDQSPQKTRYCPFCRIGVGNLPRHLERKHSEEQEVKQFLKLDKKSHERIELLALLRKRGDQLHNLEVSKKVKIILQ